MPADSLAKYFWQHVAERPDTPALFTSDPATIAATEGDVQKSGVVQNKDLPWKGLTWRELADRVVATANCIARQWPEMQLDAPGGMSENAPVPVIASRMSNSAFWITVELACHSLGIAHASIDAREQPDRAAEMARSAGAESLLTGPQDIGAPSDKDPHTLQTLAKAAWRIDGNQDSVVIFTSGSTGQPSGVVLSSLAIVLNAQAKLNAAPQHRSDLRLNVLPFSHAYARTCELATWLITGGQLAICNDWKHFVSNCRQLNPTLINAVPLLAGRIADLLDESPLALGNRVRLLQVGGAALQEVLWKRLAQHGLPPIQGYGLSEAGPVVCSGRDGLQSYGDVGFPISGVQIRTDASGELYVRGPSLLSRRLGSTSTGVSKDGWLATGDLARIESSGRVHILGRKNRRITLSNGLNVDPQQIESRIEQLDAIQHCIISVWQQIDSIGNSIVNATDQLTAFVWTSGDSFDAKEQEFAVSLLSDLPGYAIPRRWQVNPCPISNDLLTAKGTLRKQAVLDCIASASRADV